MPPACWGWVRGSAASAWLFLSRDTSLGGPDLWEDCLLWSTQAVENMWRDHPEVREMPEDPICSSPQVSRFPQPRHQKCNELSLWTIPGPAAVWPQLWESLHEKGLADTQWVEWGERGRESESERERERERERGREREEGSCSTRFGIDQSMHFQGL